MKSPFALAAVLAAFAACTSTTKGEGGSSSSSSSSGSTTSSGGSSSGDSISVAQCQSRCISKVYQCAPGADDPTEPCRDICSSGAYTQEQLDCFQSAPCAELMTEGARFEDICPP